VIGLAGSDDKCAWLQSLGFDAAINYKGKSQAELAKAIGAVRGPSLSLSVSVYYIAQRSTCF
jgi:NADPH-dependent curcumin reductase CurA